MEIRGNISPDHDPIKIEWGLGKPLRWRFEELWADSEEAWREARAHWENGTFKMSMIWDFISGSFRFYFPELMRKKTREEIISRLHKVSERCWDEGACGKCSCGLPQVAFSSKGCFCYEKM